MGGRRVGWLGVLPGPELEAIADIRFVDRQKRMFLAVAGAVVLLAGLAAFPLAVAEVFRPGASTQDVVRVVERAFEGSS